MKIGSDAVQLLDHVTQQNAALVEESAAAAESLKHQAAHLAEAVQVFRLHDKHGLGDRPLQFGQPSRPVLTARQQRLGTGLLTIFCRHTSASLLIQENAAPAARR